jgi:hypothetical protein
MNEAEFWHRVIREGLPRFRFLRRSLAAEQLDDRFRESRLSSDWQQLKGKLLPGDTIWPFEIALRPYLGLRRGIVVVRAGQAVGGIVTESS